MKFFNNIFKDDKYLFADLKPGERIYKVIETYIFPDLEKIGFKMNKSSLTITRKVGDFKQEIYFAKNKWNNGNEVVSFDPHFAVSSTTYVKWHKSKYGEAPMNDSVFGTRAHYIPNWTHEFFKDWWYDLAKDDNNEIVKVLKTNIENNGLAYLNTLSDRQRAINFIIGQNFYYKAPMLFDFAVMLNDKQQAEKILTWFNNHRNNSESNFHPDTLKDIEIRIKKLNNWV